MAPRSGIGPLALLLALCAPDGVQAQSVVTSTAPDKVGVTIYRNPEREADEEPDLDWLGGYALVTETRTVEIPAGRAVIRFEGVAAGMLPESALVTGLPSGVREKNLDADLLAPRSLYARSFGRPVTLRREDGRTGTITEQRAVIRSGPDGAAILQTKAGFEAVDCGQLTESLVYDGVPEGLSARPTLSVETEASTASRATIQLSYLAWGFDWQSNYVVSMETGGRKASILAWVTLASSDSTSFSDAEAAVVGGEVNREDEAAYADNGGEELEFTCYYRPAPPLYSMSPAPPPPPMMMAEAADIVVTAMRVPAQSTPIAVTVIEEGLGDLKLYRVPMPTTVAAKAQKQVAMFQLDDVSLDIVYRNKLWAGSDAPDDPAIMLRTKNTREKGLGRALPAGKVTVFEPQGSARLLSGEGTIEDTAIGQDVEIELGEATQVTVDGEEIESDPKGKWTTYRFTVSNANPWPIAYEAKFQHGAMQRIERVSGKVEIRDGRMTWKVTVPANGTAQLRYRLRDLDSD